MSEDRKCHAVTWRIRNFSFICGGKDVTSPSFFENTMDGTMWHLLLNPNSKNFKGCVACYLYREDDDDGPNQYEIDYELSFLDKGGSILLSEKYLQKCYQKGVLDYSAALREKRNEILSHKALFIPDDILTIRCRMWDREKEIIQSGICFAETRMETECRTFIGTIKKFSNTKASCKNIVCMKSSSTETFVSSVHLQVAADGKLVIEIQFLDLELLEKYKCKIFIRDVFGNAWKVGQVEFPTTKLLSISLNILKDYLIENKGYYLPEDELTIECGVIFSTGNRIGKIYEPDCGFDHQGTQEMISSGETIIKTNLYSEKHLVENLRKLKDDWISLFKDRSLCDTILKTTTETFPAHIAVLSARSPVFKTMFTTDMKEKNYHCVDIDDLDADTVRRMLLFMYSATLEDLRFESAKSLYFAADKYSIVSLRQECSNFLKQNLLQSNCCDTLLLADKHQDDDLKNAVQDYIAKNDVAVFFSNEWKNLENNNSQLATEVLRTVYMKNRRT